MGVGVGVGRIKKLGLKNSGMGGVTICVCGSLLASLRGVLYHQ